MQTPEQGQLSIFPRSIDEYFLTLLRCGQQNNWSLTVIKKRKHDRVDGRTRRKIDSWIEPTPSH